MQNMSKGMSNRVLKVKIEQANQLITLQLKKIFLLDKILTNLLQSKQEIWREAWSAMP